MSNLYSINQQLKELKRKMYEVLTKFDMVDFLYISDRNDLINSERHRVDLINPERRSYSDQKSEMQCLSEFIRSIVAIALKFRLCKWNFLKMVDFLYIAYRNDLINSERR